MSQTCSPAFFRRPKDGDDDTSAIDREAASDDDSMKPTFSQPTVASNLSSHWAPRRTVGEVPKLKDVAKRVMVETRELSGDTLDQGVTSQGLPVPSSPGPTPSSRMSMSMPLNLFRDSSVAGTRSVSRHSTPSHEQIVRTLLRFTPALLHQHLRSVESPDPNSGLSGSYRLALLLIDVSGFTNMSVKLGAEQTRKHTSAFFEKIIGCIQSRGGDVLKFLGDALLVSWPAVINAPIDEQRRLAVDAASCAAEVMLKLNGYRVSSDIQLTLHGGLAIGDVYAYDVGTKERREFLIGGEVLAELGDMESEASSGQIVMSRIFADLLPAEACTQLSSGHVRLNLQIMQWSSFALHFVNAEKARDGDLAVAVADCLAMQYDTSDDGSDAIERLGAEKHAKLLEFARSVRPHLRAHVPQACVDAIREGSVEWIGEMRQVTTMFISLDALESHLNTGDLSTVQKVFTLIIESVKYEEGAVRQFVLDDKGCVAICLWGVPKAAHGKGPDAIRALQCAPEILDGVKGLMANEAGPHIGVTAGEVYVGLIGASQRCEYAVVGPSVNLSARLMGKAPPWTVFVDDEVRNRALKQDGSWQFIMHEPVQAKGYKEKVQVYSPQYPYLGQIEHMLSSEDSLTAFWDTMGLSVREVAKVASVLADGPDGASIDFPLHGLVQVMADLGMATRDETKRAVIELKTCQPRFLRLTRGARRGIPSYAFAIDKVRHWVLALLTKEDTYQLREAFVDYCKKWLQRAETEDGLDPVVAKAKLTILHNEVDVRIKHHQAQIALERPKPAFSLTQWFECCSTRQS